MNTKTLQRREISRRQFLQAAGATAASLATTSLLAAQPASAELRLGMMLQGNTAEELRQRAKEIAAAGFGAVQLTFFFQPTSEDLQSLAVTLKELKLKTVAFGTYFNLFRPDDTGFMGANQAVMKLVASHAGLFDCAQFVTWSGSYSPRFDGVETRNHSPEAVRQLHQAIREIVLPILKPIKGRVAFEPYYPHVLGSVELAKQVLDPFPAGQVGLVLDPPNFISPELYSKRADEMKRLFRELGPRIHLAHFKDLMLNPAKKSVDLPGPGGGEMDYPLLIAEIRKLKRPIPCIIEHIKAELVEMVRTKAWVEHQLRQNQ